MNERIRSTIAYASGPILGLASGPILARSLGPEGRGQFAAIMQPITIGTTIAAFGIPTTITYFIAKRYSRRNIKQYAVRSLIVTTTLVYALLIVYATTLSKAQNMSFTGLISIWSFIYISVIVEYRRGFLLGSGSLKRLDAERLFFSISRFSCILLAWKFSILNAEQLSLMLLLSFACTSILLWIPRVHYTNKSANVRYQDKSANVRYQEFSKYMIPAAAVSITSVMVARLDQVLLPLQTSSIEVGYYAVAVTVSEVPLIFAILAGRATLYSSSIGEPLPIQIQKSRVFIILGFLLTLMIMLISYPLVIHIFGLQFKSCYPITLVLLISTILSLPNAVIISSLCGSGKELKAALVSFSALIPIAVGYAKYWGEIQGYQAAWIALQSQIAVLIFGSIFIIRMSIEEKLLNDFDVNKTTI